MIIRGCVALGALWWAVAGASEIAFEPFGYDQGSRLAGGTSDGGSGWNGGWEATTGAGFSVETGRAAGSGAPLGSVRGLANPFSLNSGIFYFGFTARADAGASLKFQLKQTSPSYSRWVFVRHPDGSCSIQAGTTTTTSAPGRFAAGREYVVVSKFDTSGDVASVKLFDTSGPEDYLTEPASWDLVADGLTGVTIDAVEIRGSSGEASVDEVRIGTTYADVISGLRKTFVFAVDEPVTNQAASWTHTVREAGDYQLGLAWVEALAGGDVAVEVFHNAMRVKAFYAMPGKVTRFETRLENLAAGDVITVKTDPAGASYRIGYEVAFGTPTFVGLPVYEVATFGAVGDGVTDDMAAIRAAVTAAREAGGGIVRLDGTRTYRVVGQADLTEEHLFDLQGATDISIAGNGATVLLHPPDGLANVRYAENIQIDGLTVDFDPKPYYQGTITNIDVANLTIDITVPERYPVPVIGTAPTHAPFFGRSFIPDAPGARTGRGANIYVESVMQNGSERELRIQVPEIGNGAAMAPRVQEALDNNATEFVVPHNVYGHLGGRSFIMHSSRVTCSNLRQVCAPYFWLPITHNVGPVTLSNVDLQMTEPETELFVSWRDGMHIKNGRWGILIEEGDWDGAAIYDDTFALYSRTQELVGVAGNVATLTPSFEGRETFLWQPGDWASFWSPDQETLRGMARAIGAVNVAAPNFEVTLESIPPGVTAGDIVIHEESLNRGTVIRNCRSTGIGTESSSTRFRGTDVLFQDNRFEDFGFRLEYSTAFASPRARDIVIEDCYLRAEEGRVILSRPLGVTFRGGLIDETDVYCHLGAKEIAFDGVAFDNMRGAILDIVSKSTVSLFGDSSRNGSTAGLSSWVAVDGSSTVSYTAPAGYLPAVPPSNGEDTVAPGPPAGLKVGAQDSGAWLDWDRSPEPDVHTYKVCRGTAAGGPYTEVASNLLVSKWIDHGVTNGTSYHYVVTALDNSGNESPFSDEVAVLPVVPVEIAFEDFGYGDLAALEGGIARGGRGWVGGWEAASGGGLSVTGGRLGGTGGTTRELRNPFSLDGPDTWFSFLARTDAAGAFAFNLKQTSGDYVRWAIARNGDGSITVNGASALETSAPGLFAADTEYLVVSRYESAGDIGHFKLFESLAPGDISAEPAAWDLTADGLSGVTIDRLDIELTAGSVTLDDLRIGRTYGSVAVLPPGYASWAGHFSLVGGPGDDDDGDSVQNLMEYAVGGDPSDAGDPGFSPVTGTSNDAGTKWFTYTFPKRSDPKGGIACNATISETLMPGSWTSTGVELIGTVTDGFAPGIDAVTVCTAITGKSRLFIRLEVELP